MKCSKIREMTEQEIQQKARDFKDKMFRVKNENTFGRSRNPLQARNLRRDIARLKTVLSEIRLSKQKK